MRGARLLELGEPASRRWRFIGAARSPLSGFYRRARVGASVLLRTRSGSMERRCGTRHLSAIVVLWCD